jgi:hypothetical protein
MGTIKANTIQPLTGSDPLVLKTNDSERLRILTGGNIGIGTASPSTLLDVNGTVKSTGMYCTGNVGIGTASPSVPLQVVGTVKNTNPVFEVTHSFKPAPARTTNNQEVNLEMAWDIKVIDNYGAYSTNTGRYTAPVSGKYFFTCNMRFLVNGEANFSAYGLIYFVKSGVQISQVFLTPNTGTNNYINYASVSGSVLVDMDTAVGDWVSVCYRGTPWPYDSSNFNGYFIG